MSVPTGGQESCSTDDDRTGRQKVNDDHYKIGYFVGSLSSTCIKRVLSEALIRLAPEDLEFTEIPIGNLPLYSPDYDANYSPEPPRMKDAITAVDAVLFITPKNNRSIPGALKNAIDWASRPWGAELLRPHPGRRARASIGAIGTAVGQQSLRAVLSFCNAKPMTSQEAYIHYSPEVFTDDGEITNESTKEFLRNYSPRPVYGPGGATAAVRRIHDEVRRSAPLRTTP